MVHSGSVTESYVTIMRDDRVRSRTTLRRPTRLRTWRVATNSCCRRSVTCIASKPQRCTDANSCAKQCTYRWRVSPVLGRHGSGALTSLVLLRASARFLFCCLVGASVLKLWRWVGEFALLKGMDEDLIDTAVDGPRLSS